MKFYLLPLIFLFATPLIGQLTILEDVLAKIEEANGGKEAMAKVKSLLINGTLTEADNSYRFSLIKKRPHFFRLEIDRKDKIKIVNGFDGESYWRVLQSGPYTQEIELTEDEVLLLSSHTDFDGRLISLEDDYEHLELLEMERVGRIDCYVLGYTINDIEYRSYVDSRTFRDVQILTIKNDGGTNSSSVSKFNDMRRVGVFWVPYEIETILSNELVNKVEIETIELSVGVFDFIFDKPKEKLPLSSASTD